MNAPKPGTFRSAWRHRGWRLLLTGFAVSCIGDFLYSVALVVYLIDETGSAGWVAAAMIGRMAVSTVLGPIGGVVADRHDRRRLMILLDLGRAGLMALAALSIVTGLSPVAVIVLTMASAGLSTAYRPAAVAATPALVGEDDLSAANAAEASIGGIAWFVGPALGAAIIAVSSASIAFTVNAATFLLSALLIVPITSFGGGEVGADGERTTLLRGLSEGVSAVRVEPGLAALTMLLIAVLFAYGVEQVAHVVVVRDRLDLDASAVGLLGAFIGAGSMLAAPFSGRLGTHRSSGQLLALSGALMGAPLVLLAVTTNLPVACALMLVEGFGNIAFEVLLITLLQRACPDALLGRVFALQDSGGALAQLLGTLAAPLLIAMVNVQLALVVGGGMLVAASVLLAPSLQAIATRTEQERLRLAPLTAHLSRLGIFGDASQAALERIARAVTTRRVEVGERVFAEGDEPDNLYVLTSGRVQVSTEQHGVVRELGVDDWFGEIGLLRSTARTASVDALTATELIVIPGDVFVEALTNVVLPDPVTRAMNVRLARTHPHLVASTFDADVPRLATE